MYVDGRLDVRSADNTSGDLVFGNDILIGGSGQESQFKGVIDDVRVYNYALSQTEIQKLYVEAVTRTR